MQRPRRILLILGVTAAALLGVVAYLLLRPPPLVRALPASATNVHHYYEDLFPDGSLFLAAQLNEKDVELYMNRMGLVEVKPPDMVPMEGPIKTTLPWWNPQRALEPRARQLERATTTNDRVVVEALYGNGYLYLKAFDY